MHSMVTIVSTFSQSTVLQMISLKHAYGYLVYTVVFTITDSREVLTASNIIHTRPVQVMI